MARLSVLMCSEGTYPYHEGGVSVWCDQLIHGLPEVDFQIFRDYPGTQQKTGLSNSLERYWVAPGLSVGSSRTWLYRGWLFCPHIRAQSSDHL